MTASTVLVSDWFIAQGDAEKLVCTRMDLALTDDDRACATVDGADLELRWTGGTGRLLGAASAGWRAGERWMLGIVDARGCPRAAMRVRMAP